MYVNTRYTCDLMIHDVETISGNVPGSIISFTRNIEEALQNWLELNRCVDPLDPAIQSVRVECSGLEKYLAETGAFYQPPDVDRLRRRAVKAILDFDLKFNSH